MANNYSEMSIAFPVTYEQAEWLVAVWTVLDTIAHIEPPESDPELPAGFTLGDEDYVPCSLEILEEPERQAWLYTEESVDAETLTRVLQQFLKHFDDDRGIGIEAAQICSKPRIGEFGGFAIWVTKDNVEAMSTSGWLAEREKVHERSRVLASISTEQALNRRIDELHGPGAAAALDQAIVDGTIFGELEAKEDEPTHVTSGVCPAHGAIGVCPKDGVLYQGDPEGRLSTCARCGGTIAKQAVGWAHVSDPLGTEHEAEPDDSAVSRPAEDDIEPR